VEGSLESSEAEEDDAREERADAETNVGNWSECASSG